MFVKIGRLINLYFIIIIIVILMRLGFGKILENFYVAIDSNPNNTVGSSYLR